MNAVVHYLGGYGLRPTWWLIVGVSAIPPATLGAVVHLAVLVGRPDAVGGTGAGPDGPDIAETAVTDDASGVQVNLGRRRLARELGVSEYQARRLLAAQRNGAAS
jgi:hypothetical protein